MIIRISTEGQYELRKALIELDDMDDHADAVVGDAEALRIDLLQS